MAVHLEIRHTTTYKCATPVTFGPHRAVFLPRVAMRGHLLSWSAKTTPPSRIRWVGDPLANNITVMEFSEPSAELTFMIQFRGVHYGARPAEEFPLETRAEEVPVQHTPDEWTDLGGFHATPRRGLRFQRRRGPKASSPTTATERLMS